MNYYPDRIADDSDDDVLTSCSAVEAVDAAVPNDEVEEDFGYHHNKHHPWKRKDGADSDNNNLYGDDNDSVELEISRHGSSNHTQRSSRTGEGSKRNQIDTEKEVKMAHMIQHERDRRLGVVRNHVDYQVDSRNNAEEMKLNENYNSSSNNLLGNIRGWFGGVGGNNNANKQSNQHTRRQSEPATSLVQSTKHTQRASDGYLESDDDSSSTSSDDCSSSDDDDSSSDSENDYAEEDLTPQERARTRALRYLSNSCVDAGRKAKTASYIRGLERLDLKRKRDRLEKELDIVETEMNKDRGRITNVESDCVVATAAKLVLELPCISDASSSDGNGNWQVTTYDEYMAMMVNDDDPNKDLSSLWDNKEATDTYVSSLQSRLKEALERTRSLEKRLAILEQAGDEIIMSLCEDLVEVTSDSNKAEARYVKKGKELAAKRRREKIRYQQKIKKAERHVRHLEERLLGANGRAEQEKSDQSVASSDSSGSSDDDEQENDEVRLEAKLSSIKSKIEENKADHKAEMESVRRQCEQLKLRMSVAKLVMLENGAENLREYIAILVRAQSKLLDRCEDIPTPPQPITRGRAKLLKVIHLENIYEQRLSVSKAFSDATINALEQELIERETSGQKMEVRCLNELVAIERETKSFAQDANNRIAKLEAEARELEETVAACIGESMEVAMGALVIVESQSVPATDDDSTSESYSDDDVDDPEPAALDRRDANLQKSVDGVGKSIREDSRNDAPELENDDATLMKYDENITTSTSDGDTYRDERSASSPTSDNDSDGVKAGKQNVLTLQGFNGDETPDRESSHGSDIKDAYEANLDGKPINEGKRAQSEDATETKSINNCQPFIDSSSLGSNKDALELLGHKLKDTLSQYQKSRDSTSAERIKHLTNMNLLVLEIAKAKGVDLESTPNLGTLTSWRRKKSRSDRKQAEREKKRRSEKEKKRRRGKEKGRRKHEDERNLSLVW